MQSQFIIALVLVIALIVFTPRLAIADSAYEQAYYYRAFCADTPVYNLWKPELLEGKWSVVRFKSPYSSNTLPLPNECAKIEISPGSSNETKIWSTSLKAADGEILTGTREAKLTSLEISAGRWMVRDYGIFTRDEYAQESVASLMMLGYTSGGQTNYYSTLLYASCTWIHISMGTVVNRLGEFGILVREGEESLYDDQYFAEKYNRALELAQLGTTDQMAIVSHDQC